MSNLTDWSLSLASTASEVNIRERQVGDVLILDVDGNIIVGESADAVRDIIRRLLAEGHRKILLNMAQVRWIDSRGIGELVAALVAVAREGGQIKLLMVRENIEELLTVTRIDTIFGIYDDELEALNDYV
ncbi:MAG: STAS domain-containing protein [Acidobacteriota bacterium]|nr:STAS domain-containing protein [Acidobacteriota bacterium]